MRALLEIQNLSIDYRVRDELRRVVDDVSLSIHRGEAYGLVGESGCGKTTLAMAVMRYLSRNARVCGGRILFEGVDVYQLAPENLRRLRGNRIAAVYQDPASALTPTMTTGDQIAEVFVLHRAMRRGEAVKAAIRMLEVVHVADASRVAASYPHELSGGQQQRVMLAMALATDPDLLVLDEPTTGLDATVEAEILDLIDGLRKSFNAAILFISHDLAVVSRLCERVGVLYSGDLVEESRTTVVFDAPAHPYTAALLECVPRPGIEKRLAPLKPIPGSLPRLGCKMQGCRFSPRCASATETCRQERPARADVGAAHWAKCFHPASRNPEPVASHAISAEKIARGSSLLHVAGLKKSFQTASHRVVAVDDVSIDVREGEIVGVVGESGSGKSTIAKAMVGLIPPDGGSVSLCDVALAPVVERRSPEQQRQIQMVFQNPDGALNPRHTVRNILRRAVLLLGRERSRKAVDERVEMVARAVRLEPHHLDLRAASLSGGLKQRVAIACAFAGSPKIVLCDEAASALDVSVQAAILELLIDLSDSQGVSYVFISHDLDVVRYIADRVYVMYLGKVIEVGTTRDVFSPPHHPYTEVLASAAISLGDKRDRVRIRLQAATDAGIPLSTGCPFEPRCPRSLGTQCRDIEPPLQVATSTHSYRCHIAPDELCKAQSVLLSNSTVVTQ